MPDQTNPNLPDPLDSNALEAWLRPKPQPLVVAFATRMALLALPGLGELKPKYISIHGTSDPVLKWFRATVASLYAAKFPNRVATKAAAAASRTFAKSYETPFATAVFAAAYAADSASVTATAAAAVGAAERAIYAIVDTDSIEQVRPQIIMAIKELEAAEAQSNGALWYLSRPVWTDGQAPILQASCWAKLRRNLPANEEWDVWLDWAEARFRGQPDWPKAVYDELTQWRKEWARDPALVNADIMALLAKHKPKPKQSVERWDFFFSHTTKNNATASWIYDVVRSAGKSAFFHPRDEKQAASIVSRINDGLTNSERLIALLSAPYFKSRYCKDEWNAFYQRETEQNRDLIVQFKLQGDIPWPLAKGKRWHSLLGKSRADQVATVLKAVGYEGELPGTPETSPALSDQRRVRKKYGGGYAVAPADAMKLKRLPNKLAAANDEEDSVTPDEILRQLRKWAGKMLADAENPSKDGTNAEFPKPLHRRIKSIAGELALRPDRMDVLALHSDLRDFLPLVLMDMEEGNISKRSVWRMHLTRCMEFMAMLPQIFPRVAAYTKLASKNFPDTLSEEVRNAIARFRDKLKHKVSVANALEASLRDELLDSFDRAMSADKRAEKAKDAAARQEIREAASSAKTEAIVKLLAVWEWISDPVQTAQLEKFPEEKRAELSKIMLDAYRDLNKDVLEILEYFLMRLK